MKAYRTGPTHLRGHRTDQGSTLTTLTGGARARGLPYLAPPSRRQWGANLEPS
jgi:hypothetical protein